MGKYGEAALKATKLLNSQNTYLPSEAWETATIGIFGEGSSSQKKGCPKATFVGLCEEGLIKGIRKGNYLKRNQSKNKDYGIKAIRLLQTNPNLKNDSKQLWSYVIGDEPKRHNSQMDVVISLWNNNLISI